MCFFTADLDVAAKLEPSIEFLLHFKGSKLSVERQNAFDKSTNLH